MDPFLFFRNPDSAKVYGYKSSTQLLGDHLNFQRSAFVVLFGDEAMTDTF